MRRCTITLWGRTKTYKELAGVVTELGLLGRVLHLGRHIDQLGLLVELGFEGLQEGVAGHGPAVGTRGGVQGRRGDLGRGSSVAEGVVGVEFERQAGRGTAVCWYK